MQPSSSHHASTYVMTEHALMHAKAFKAIDEMVQLL